MRIERWIQTLPLRLRSLFQRKRVEQELDDEIRDHIERQTQANVAAGMSLGDARTAALRAFGGVERRKEEVRATRGIALIEDLSQDVRYAARGLARRPGFTAVAVLTLAIGIGATTTIFSAIDTLLLRPLPFKDPDRLMVVSVVTPPTAKQPGGGDMTWSYPKFLFFRDQQQVFESLALTTISRFNVTDGDADQIGGEHVDSRYLPTLGIPVQLGGNFPSDEDAHPDAPRIAIISDGLWRGRFGGDPSIIGKSIQLDLQNYEIVGVTPQGFRGLTGLADLFVPITTRSATVLGRTMAHQFTMIARLRPSISIDQAKSAVAVLGVRVGIAFPAPSFMKGLWRAKAQGLDSVRTAQEMKQALLVLFGAVTFVLLIACANLANLLLGRAYARRHEIAVRLALGAGRSRIVRLLLAESVLLALLGGAAGVVLARGGTLALTRFTPGELGISGGHIGAVGFADIRLDATALAFALGVATLVGIAFGVAPALQATSPNVTNALKGSGAETGGLAVSRRFTIRQFLIVSEVALAIVLLASSGLMIRSLTNLIGVDPGFDPQHVLTVRLTVPAPAYVRDSMPAFYSELTERLNALPGATAVALSDCALFGGGPFGDCSSTRIALLDGPPLDQALQPIVGLHLVTPNWFATMRVVSERGRTFNDADRIGTPKVVVVSATAAHRFWPGDNPIGKKVGVSIAGFDTAEVIGVVADVRQRLDTLPGPNVYLAYAQSPSARMTVFVRTAGEPTSLAAAVRRAVRDVAPEYPLYDIQPMTGRVAESLARVRFSAVLLTLFAATSLALALVGIYGMMSFAVTQRTREIGIRMALGADRSRVLNLVVGQGAALAGIGAVVGVAGALAATRLLRSLLFDVRPSDPATYMSIVCLFVAAAMFASWIPARRATKVDPTEALRAE